MYTELSYSEKTTAETLVLGVAPAKSYVLLKTPLLFPLVPF